MATVVASRVHRGSRLPWALWALSLALAIPGCVFVALNGNSILENVSLGIIFSSMGLVGALIASRRRENPIGWVLLGSTTVIALAFVTSEYSVYATEGRATPLPGSNWAAWVGSWAWAAALGPIMTLLFLLFPDGRLPSPRWRPVAVASVAVIGIIVLFGAVNPQADLGIAGRNPIGINALGAVAEAIIGFGFLVLVVLGAFSAASLFVRFRRASGEERQQIKWLALSAIVVATWITLSALGEALNIEALRDSEVMGVFSALALLSIPVAVGIAMLRYRLYEIDVVIRKTLVVAVLAAFITIVYVGLVVGVGALVAGTATEGPLPIIAAVIIAVAFQPVRVRANRIANRLVLGERATPYQVLSEFSQRLAGADVSDDLLTRMATLIGQGAGVQRAVVWLRIGEEVRPAVSWPTEDLGGSSAPAKEARPLIDGGLPELGGSRALDVRHEGELLGAISVEERPGEPLSHEAERLLEHLASQAGLVLRNARLTEELRARLVELQASRQRIVAAQDEERRRLERNLHDGAQQQIVALAVKQRLVGMLVTRDPGKAAAMIEELQRETGEALDNLRDLARGIYPPLLADQGLVAALQSQASKAAVPTSVEAHGIDRYAQEVEAAVYFCCLEALQNVAKYARADGVVISLSGAGDALMFEVADDGEGFDSALAPRGAGLTNMADRLAALGGELEVRSRPGAGTTVIGTIPLVAATGGTEPHDAAAGDAPAGDAPAAVRSSLA
jgi:signal transduction histidine kinase